MIKIINPVLQKISKRQNNTFVLEKEFLKICSKKKLDNTDTKLLKKIAKQDINWDWLYLLAEYNSVAPIVCMNLSKLTDFIPEKILKRFKRSYTESFLKTAPVYDDISKLLNEFNALGLKVIMLKGCSLAEQLYQDFSLRPMKDVDILVKKQDWPEIRNILKRLNFKSNLDPLKLEFLSGIPMDSHVSYMGQRNTKIEFKFNLFVLDFPNFSSQEYWYEAISIKVNDVETLSLSIEDQILYLSTRMINVGFRNLLWFCDLRELINFHRKKINWQKLITKAKQKHVTIALYNSLLLLNKELGVDIPQEVLIMLKPNTLRQKVFNIFYGFDNCLFITPEKVNYPNPTISLCLLFDKFHLRIKDVSKLLHYVLKIFLPPSKYIIYRYGSSEKPLNICYWYFFRVKAFLIRFANLGKIINIHIFSNKKLASRLS
jgi:hypothetical protein